MDDLFTTLLSFQFALMCLALGLLVYVIRTVAEAALSNLLLSDNKVWKDVALPLLPILLGCLTALPFMNLGYPDSITTTGAKVAFGAVAGFSSSTVFRMFKSFLTKKENS